MKRIGLLSDTHGMWDDKFYEYFKDCDEIWHAGDIGTLQLADKFENFKSFRAVYGNIDDASVRAAYPKTSRFEIEGVDVLMTHIGGYPGRYNSEVLKIIKENAPQLFICGHSHILKVIYDKKYDCLHINPGAAGIYGIHQVRTLIRFVLDNGNIRDLEIIEMKRD